MTCHAIAALAVATGCNATGVFACEEDAQCRLGGVTGVCQPTRYCSFPDALCASGYRYDELAGDGYAGTCVGGMTIDAPETVDAPPGTPDGSPAGCLTGLGAGDGHACARKANGSLTCWGRNTEGQLTDELAVPEQEMPGTLTMVTATLVEGGFRHSCLRIAGDAARCVGANMSGQLGDSSMASTGTPVEPMGLGPIDDIDAGSEFTCAIASADGGVYCWGRNVEGQLGDDSGLQRLVPVRVQRAAGGNLVGATDVAAGHRHACAIASGSASCWGFNNHGQLGDGTTMSRLSAVPVGQLTAVTRIDAGREHTCAVASGGSVWCWGMNDESQAGDGTGDGELLAPVMVVASGASAIELGDDHGCAVLSGGALACWGRNAEGQVADPASAEVLAPSSVTDLGGSVTAAALGGQFSCFVVAGETVQCRGLNTSAQLGIGPADPTPVPHPVPQTLAVGCP